MNGQYPGEFITHIDVEAISRRFQVWDDRYFSKRTAESETTVRTVRDFSKPDTWTERTVPNPLTRMREKMQVLIKAMRIYLVPAQPSMGCKPSAPSAVVPTPPGSV